MIGNLGVGVRIGGGSSGTGPAAGQAAGVKPPDPWPNFRFIVEIKGIGALRCQKVQNIGVDSQPEDAQTGGRHGPGLMLPPTKWTWKRLQLARGMAKDGTALWKWVIDTVNKRPIQPHDVTISLLNMEGKPQMQWTFAEAFPTSWNLQPLDATSNGNLAVETMEFAHQGVTIQFMGG